MSNKRLTSNETNVLVALAREGYSLQKRSRDFGGDRFVVVASDGYIDKYALPQTVKSLAAKGYIAPEKEDDKGFPYLYMITDDGKDRAEFLEEAAS